jgi:hypothetical protein
VKPILNLRAKAVSAILPALLAPALLIGAQGTAQAADVVAAPQIQLAAATNARPGDGTDIGALVGEYNSWRRDLITIAQGDVSPVSVKKAHQRLAARNYKSMARAWVAYQAAVASRTPEFNKEVQKKSKRDAAGFLASLDTSRDKALQLRSSGKAAQAIIRNINAETAQLSEMGNSFRQAAINLQQNKPAVLAINKTTMNRFIDPTRSDNLILAGASGGMPQDPRSNTKARPMLGQMLTLAAHMSVNEPGGQGYAPSTASLVENKKGERCLKWAKLNLAQCLAATRDTSEEAFCTGRHALSEVSACWSYMSTPSGVAS